MHRDNLDVLMVVAALDVPVLDPQVREMHLLIEVRQVVLVRPIFNLPVGSVGVPVVVVPLPVPSVQPFLVLALQFIVEDHALDLGTAFREPVGRLQVGVVDLRVMLELPARASRRRNIPGAGRDRPVDATPGDRDRGLSA